MNKTDALSADLLGELTAATEDVSAVRQAEPIIRDFLHGDNGALLGNAFSEIIRHWHPLPHSFRQK